MGELGSGRRVRVQGLQGLQGLTVGITVESFTTPRTASPK
jgi:hypothetical protein